MVNLISLQTLRGFALVYDMRGMYDFVDGLIDGVLCADLDWCCDLIGRAGAAGVDEFQQYLDENPAKYRILRDHVITAVRHLTYLYRFDLDVKVPFLDMDVCKMIKELVGLL